MNSSEATQILQSVSAGDRSRVSRLAELVYGELRKLASRYTRREPSGKSLQPTELVHEAFIRLMDGDRVDWRSRTHFFAVAATVMRHVLVDEARKRLQEKRGGGQLHLSITDGLPLSVERDDDVLALDELLARLARENKSAARLVELRFFGGMTMDEIAEADGRSTRTLEREWRLTRAWLRRELTIDS